MSFGLRGVEFQLGFKNGPRKVKIMPVCLFGCGFGFGLWLAIPSSDSSTGSPAFAAPGFLRLAQWLMQRRLSKIIEDYQLRRKSFFLISIFFWIFFATPDRAQREQPNGGQKKSCVCAFARRGALKFK